MVWAVLHEHLLDCSRQQHAVKLVCFECLYTKGSTAATENTQ